MNGILLKRNNFYLIDFGFVRSKKTVQLVESKKELACDLIASWTVQVGDMDQCVHLWRYTGGFEKIDKASAELALDKVCASISYNLKGLH